MSPFAIQWLKSRMPLMLLAFVLAILTKLTECQ